jgi:hypothetical protein
VVILPDRRVIESPQPVKKVLALDGGKGQKWPYPHLGQFFSYFLTEKNYMFPSQKFKKKLFLSKKMTKLPA